MKKVLALTSCEYTIDNHDENAWKQGATLRLRSLDVAFPLKTKPVISALANLSIVLFLALATGAQGQTADVQRQFPFTFTLSVDASVPSIPLFQTGYIAFPPDAIALLQGQLGTVDGFGMYLTANTVTLQGKGTPGTPSSDTSLGTALSNEFQIKLNPDGFAFNPFLSNVIQFDGSIYGVSDFTGTFGSPVNFTSAAVGVVNPVYFLPSLNQNARGIFVNLTSEAGPYNYSPYVAGNWTVTLGGTFFVSYIPSGCQAPLPVSYLQLTTPAPPGGPWGEANYDSLLRADGTPYKIKEQGCAMTSLCMALNFAGVAKINGQPNNPGELNKFMSSYLPWPTYELLPIPFRATGKVLWGATVKALNPRLKFDTFNGSQDSQNNPDAAYQTLDHFLCNGPVSYPVIVGVTSLSNPSGKFPGHYVVVTAKVARPDGAKYLIADPANRGTSLDYYGHFQTRGAVVPKTASFPKTAITSLAAVTTAAITPGDDLSSVTLDVDTPADLLVIAPTGQRTGYDPTTGTRSQDIPQSAHFRDAIDDDITGEPATDVGHIVEISGPPQGLYQVVVTGLEPGSYALAVRPFSQNGSAEPMVALLGIAGPGTTATFQVQLATIPGGTSQLKRVASFQGTLDDITNSLQLGLIDNQGVANSLSEKIQNAQSAATRGDTKTATNVLGAFKNELNAQTGKHVQGDAATVLLQNADSLLSQYP
jgi:hypothetical protein